MWNSMNQLQKGFLIAFVTLCLFLLLLLLSKDEHLSNSPARAEQRHGRCITGVELNIFSRTELSLSILSTQGIVTDEVAFKAWEKSGRLIETLNRLKCK